MNLPERDHLRIWSHLESYALGLADPKLSDEIENHLTGCKDCREFVEDLGLAPLPGETVGAHLPEDMIVQWPKVSATLQGMERELVRRHIGRCVLCRDNLRMLGHAAELKEVPGLEASDAVLKKLEPESDLVPESRPSWMTRLLGAWPVTTWAAAATALLVVVFANPTLLSRPSGTSGTQPTQTPVLGTDGGHGAPAAASPTFLLTTPGSGIALRGGVRSVKEPPPSTIDIGADQRTLRLFGGPDSGIPSDAMVSVTVQGPSGAFLGTMTMVHGSLWAKDGGVQVSSSAPLEPGSYEMRVAAIASTNAKPDTLVYQFELRRGAR